MRPRNGAKTKSLLCLALRMGRKTQEAFFVGFRAFHFYLESVEMLYVFVFAAKRMVEGAATLTSFAL